RPPIRSLREIDAAGIDERSFVRHRAIRATVARVRRSHLLPGLEFEFLDGLARREFPADQAGVVLRVTIGPEDRIAHAARRPHLRAAGTRGPDAGSAGRSARGAAAG